MYFYYNGMTAFETELLLLCFKNDLIMFVFFQRAGRAMFNLFDFAILSFSGIGSTLICLTNMLTYWAVYC